MDDWNRPAIEAKIKANEAGIRKLLAQIRKNERASTLDISEKTKALGRKLLAFQRLQLDEKLKLRVLYQQALEELAD